MGPFAALEGGDVLNKFRNSVCVGALLVGVAPLALASAPAWSQEATGNPVPISPQPPASSVPTSSKAITPSPAQAYGLQEIVVTARKRAESVQDVPIAVTALTANVIRQQDLTSLAKIAQRTPDLTVGAASNGSGAQLTLRGIGSLPTSIGVEQSVATVVDGAYYGQGRIIDEGFFDLARVEVLKGPQALFFGKNATAGVISITTADPTDKPEFHATGRYEFQGEQAQLEAIGSTPITDTLGIRVAVRGSKEFGDYYKDEAAAQPYNTFDIATGTLNPHTAEPAARDQPDEKEFLGRATLKWTPTSQVTDTFKIGVDYNKNDNTSWNYVIYKCPTGNSSLGGGYACGYNRVLHQNDMPADIAKNFPYAESDGSLYDRYESYSLNNTFNYKINYLTVTSVSNYNWNNNRWACACDFQSSATGTWATENSTYDAFSTELRALTTFDGPVNFLLGGLYQKTRRQFAQFIMFANIEDSSQSAADRYIATDKSSYTDGQTEAGFAQVIWKALPKVEVTGGLRYTHETKDSFFTQPYNNAAVTSIFRPSNDPDGLGVVTANQSFNALNPEGTITYKPAQGFLVYAAYKTAYKSGGFSNGGIDSKFSTNPVGDLTFSPERASGYEIGLKTTSFQRQLRFNIDAFTTRYRNFQVDFFNSPIFAFQTLTSQARTKGIEPEAEFAPRGFPGLNLHGSANYDISRYSNFIGPCVAGQTPAQGCDLDYSPLQNGGTGGFTRQDLKGAPLSLAPRWTAGLGASYDRPLNDKINFGASVDARYSSSYILSGFGDENSRQPDYSTVDASIRLAAASGFWEVSLIGKNLSNVLYLNGGNDSPSTGSGTGTAGGVRADQNGYGNLPRTVELQLTINY